MPGLPLDIGEVHSGTIDGLESVHTTGTRSHKRYSKYGMPSHSAVTERKLVHAVHLSLNSLL